MSADLPSPDQAPDLASHCLAITEHAPLPMATVDGTTHIVRYANPAFCRLMEKPIGQLIGKPLSELLPEKDECVRLLDRVFRTGKPESHTEKEPSKPHPVFWSYTMWPTQSPEGLVGIMIQVTETAKFHGETIAMNEALLLGSLRQHELTDAAEKMNAQQRVEIRASEEIASELAKIARDLAEKARLLDLTEDAIIVRDVKGRISYWNHGAEVLYGWSSEEAMGKVSHALLKTEFSIPEEQILEELHRNGRWIGELVHTTRGGKRITVLVRKTLDRDSEGNPSAVLQTLTDISERKSAEEALRASEERFHVLFDLGPVAIFSCDREGVLQNYNRRAAELWRREPKCGDGGERHCGSFKLYHADGQPLPHAESPIVEVLRTGVAVKDVDVFIERPDGSRIAVVVTFAPLKNERGKTTGAITAFYDVTSRRTAEEALRGSEERFRAAVGIVSSLIWTNNAQGLMEGEQLGWGNFTGQTREEYQAYGWTKAVHPEDAQPTLDAWKQAVAEKRLFEFEHRILRHDGEWRLCSIHAVPLPGVGGVIREWVGVHTDITERKRAEADLREAKEAAEAANRSKDRFLAVLSHELRTPLTPVLMAVAALEHDPELRRDVREEMTMIKRNIELEVKFIDDLLDVSRIASGKVPLKIEPLDLNGAVREVCASFRSQLLDQHVSLALELSGDIGLIAADATRLQQVFSNVFRNAIKFTPEQGIIQVTSARLDPARCEIRVRDSGIGIPPEALPHIFEAFEQGDTRVTRQFGGLGLGLTIAKALIELHGGSIRAESPGQGQGATFIIELPGDRPAVAAAAPPAVPEGEVPARLRLLIVEDHDDTARALRRLLTKAGFMVSVASNVATALALAGSETFDLLVSDLGLPDGTGYDVMAGLRKIQPLPGIAMSGYGMDEDVSKSRDAGFNAHLVKPVEVPKLIAAIRRVMEQKP